MTIITTKEQITFLFGNAIKLVNLMAGLYAMQIQVHFKQEPDSNVRYGAHLFCFFFLFFQDGRELMLCSSFHKLQTTLLI